MTHKLCTNNKPQQIDGISISRTYYFTHQMKLMKNFLNNSDWFFLFLADGEEKNFKSLVDLNNRTDTH